jgi:hypothetical protein
MRTAHTFDSLVVSIAGIGNHDLLQITIGPRMAVAIKKRAMGWVPKLFAPYSLGILHEALVVWFGWMLQCNLRSHSPAERQDIICSMLRCGSEELFFDR